MDVLTSEICWALNNEIIKQVTSSWSLFIQRRLCFLSMPCHESIQIRAPAVSCSLRYGSAVRTTRAFVLLNKFFLKICRLNGWKQPFVTKTHVFLCCRQLKSCKKKKFKFLLQDMKKAYRRYCELGTWSPTCRVHRRIAKDETASWIKQNTGRPTSSENYCSLRGRPNVISYCSAKMNRVQDNLWNYYWSGK